METDRDISFILILGGTNNRYSANATFGVKLYSDDLPLSKNKYRMIDSVEMQSLFASVLIYVNTEDLAWLAAASSVKIEIYNLDTQRKYDTLYFTPTGFTQFKRFAKSCFVDTELF